MKSIIPDTAQLDELAAGLDAGWDEEPVQAATSQPPLSPSQMPHSAPVPTESLDADWAEAEADSSESERAPAQATRGTATARASKRDRREAERMRRSHQAQQNTASKKQRKAERMAAARLASERQRAAEQQAIAERQGRPAKVPRKRPKPSPEVGEVAAPLKRVAKRARREQPPPPRPIAPTRQALTVKSEPQAVVTEGGLQRLIVPLLIAILVAVTLGFALSRAR